MRLRETWISERGLLIYKALPLAVPGESSQDQSHLAAAAQGDPKGWRKQRKPVSQAQTTDGRGSPTPAHAPQVRSPPTPTGSSQTLPTAPKSFRSPKPSELSDHPPALRGGETPRGKKDPGSAEETRVHRTPQPNSPGTKRPPDSLPHSQGEGRFSAPEGRYLVAGPVVHLHGGFGSPRRRSKAPVEIRLRTLASGEAPPPFIAQGFCLRSPAYVLQWTWWGRGLKDREEKLVKLSCLGELRIPRPRENFWPDLSSESKRCTLRTRTASVAIS